MRDIAGLKAGSMLSTGIPVDSTVNLLVGNQARFKTARRPRRPQARRPRARTAER